MLQCSRRSWFLPVLGERLEIKGPPRRANAALRSRALRPERKAPQLPPRPIWSELHPQRFHPALNRYNQGCLIGRGRHPFDHRPSLPQERLFGHIRSAPSLEEGCEPHPTLQGRCQVAATAERATQGPTCVRPPPPRQTAQRYVILGPQYES